MLNVYKEWVRTSDVELHVIRHSVDEKEAPFRFEEHYDNISLYTREEFDGNTLLAKINDIDPQLILCSGWSDRDYLRVVSSYRGKIPTVMTMDNQWQSTLRQKVAALIGPVVLPKLFSSIWVPGTPQVVYAKKLGFNDSQIFTGFYVANSKHFSMDHINPEHTFTKRFIYVGRYVEIKGIDDMWQAFIALQEESPNDWELLCIGAGPLYDEKVEYPGILHTGFVQPHELKQYMAEGGVFVLPSHFEPWGVVVHEFALAGFPMIVSDRVGAATQFVEDGKNGYIFRAKEVSALKEKMKEIMASTEERLKTMGDISFEKAKKVNESNWVQTANGFLYGRNG
jgi:glycosyltransferase involved in cell wall biosynthesis